jgi:hypothetical protein
LDVEEIGEAGAFGFGVADDDDLASSLPADAGGEFGEFADGFFGFGVETLDGFAGEAEGLVVLAAELMDFGPGELLNICEDGIRGIDATGVGEAVEVALGLLLDFGRFDEPDDGVGREVGEEGGGLVDATAGPGGAVAQGDEAGLVGAVGDGAEGLDVELVDGFDLVVEEVDAVRIGFAGGPDVDDFAADGKVAGVFDGVEAGVAVIGEPVDEGVAEEGLAGAKSEDEIGEESAGGGGLHQRLDGGDDEVGAGGGGVWSLES